jgi:hypothetical protein
MNLTYADVKPDVIAECRTLTTLLNFTFFTSKIRFPLSMFNDALVSR